MDSVKLRDLLKAVDADTRRCILFLNKKMDDKFKRLSAVKNAPAPKPPMDVTELRAELFKEIDEIKYYVKSRDKVNKEAIKKIDEKVGSLTKKSLSLKDGKSISESGWEKLNDDDLIDYINSLMEFGEKWAIEAEVLVSHKSGISYHPSFIETLELIRSDEERWLDYVDRVKKVPPVPVIDLRLSPEIFQIASTVVWLHSNRIRSPLERLQLFCVVQTIRLAFQHYVTDEDGNSPSEEEISVMGRDRSNWLPLEAASHTIGTVLASLLEEFRDFLSEP